uniref:Uncharacterized protein n=1 Tax=Romanomermis culicivorax TaxID=13658 RepID=A0A915JL78_ROMCU
MLLSLVEVELKQDLNIMPSQLYEKIKTDNPAPPGLEVVVNGRDRKQMANFKYGIQNKFRPMKDAIYNLNTFVRENERQFIMSIEQMAQDFLVSCMLPDRPEIINKLLTEYLNEPFVVLYNTTFELGDFYASAAIYHQKSLIGQPVFPLGILIHEKNLRKTICFNVTENGNVYLCFNVTENGNVYLFGCKRPCKDDFKNIKPKVTDIEFDDEESETQVETATCADDVKIGKPATNDFDFDTQVETATCDYDDKIGKPATKDFDFDTQVETATCDYDSQSDVVEKNNSDFTYCPEHPVETTNCAYDAGRLHIKQLEKEINSTRATIIIDSQIPSGDENEDAYKLPEMRPKPIDLQTLISNNLSNLEAEEDEDIISSLSDVDDEALLNDKNIALDTFRNLEL